MDVLSDALNVVRLAGAVFFTAQFASPWAISSPFSEVLARYLHLPSDCMALFHVVVEGTCYISIDGKVLAQVHAGEVIILPHGSAHVMTSDARLQPTPISDLLPPRPFLGIPLIEVGTRDKNHRFICGYLSCDQIFNPLIGALPKILLVRGRDQDDQTVSPEREQQLQQGAISISKDTWLEATLHYLIKEANENRQGSDVMLVRLTEIMYVEVLRRYMQFLPSTQRGWLAGVRDPIIGQTLRLLHAHPERTWTVEDLALAVDCSRSTLAQHFTTLIGESPMHYLATWRMQLAQHFLRQTNMNIEAIAERVGYESVVAFHRAFKRHVGEPPAGWRLRQTPI